MKQSALEIAHKASEFGARFDITQGPERGLLNADALPNELRASVIERWLDICSIVQEFIPPTVVSGTDVVLAAERIALRR